MSSTGVGWNPFHRRESPTQTVNDAKLQQSSMEIWGKEARFSSLLSVKAYRGAIKALQMGVEFDTAVAPQKGGGSPFEARWYHGSTPGVVKRTDSAGTDYAAIPVTRLDNRQP
jgi:hypothetical protein